MKREVFLSRRPLLQGPQPEGLEHAFTEETFGTVEAALDVVRATDAPMIFRVETWRAKRPYLYAKIGNRAVRLSAPPVRLDPLGRQDWLQAWSASKSPRAMINAYMGKFLYDAVWRSVAELCCAAADMLAVVREGLKIDPNSETVDRVLAQIRQQDFSWVRDFGAFCALIGYEDEFRSGRAFQNFIRAFAELEDCMLRPFEFRRVLNLCVQALEDGRPLLFPDESTKLADAMRRHLTEDVVFRGLCLKAEEEHTYREQLAAKRARLADHKDTVMHDAAKYLAAFTFGPKEGA